MDEFTQQIVFSIAVPLVVALVAAIPGAHRRPSLDDRRRPRRDVLAGRLPLAVGGSVVVAFAALYGRPTEQWQSVLWVAAAGTGIGLVASALPRTRGAFLGITIVLGAATLATLWPVVGRESWLLKGVVGLGPMLLYAVLEPVARRVPGAALPFALAGAAGATALIVLVSGFLKLAVPCGALAVALTALALAGARWRGLLLCDGAICAVAPLLVVAPVVASLYMIGETLPAPAFALPAAAPLVLICLLAPPARRRIALAGISLAVVLVAFSGLGLALAGGEEDAAEDPYADMYQDMMGG